MKRLESLFHIPVGLSTIPAQKGHGAVGMSSEEAPRWSEKWVTSAIGKG